MSALAIPAPIIPRLALDGLRGKLRGLRKVLAGFGNAVENKVLDHLTGKAAYASPAPLYMALVTTAVVEGDTAASITEANYTGYARKQIPAADWNAAASGAVTNSAQEVFGSCTGGSSTVIGFALVTSASGAGDVVMYGTVPSVTITTTQTPPTLAAAALSLTLD
jgi:hypothetical protein